MNTEQMRARWYSVSKDGVATLCVDEADAIETAAESQQMYPRNGPYRAVQMVPLPHPQEPARVGGVPMSDERIDHIADLVVKGMPDGIQGFLKSWGWRQFARAILADCAGHYAAPQAPADVVRDAERYRWLRSWLTSVGLLACELGQMNPGEKVENWWLLYPPYGINKTVLFLGHGKSDDAAIDAAMSTKAGEKV